MPLNSVKNKGMSQTLSLIVAATVLLMAALTVIFLTSTSIGNFGSQQRAQGCIKTIESKCQAQGGAGSVKAPGSCFTGTSPTNTFNSTYHSWGFKNDPTPTTDISCDKVVN